MLQCATWICADAEVLLYGQGLTLGQGLTTYAPGFAAAGIIALLSPMYLAVLPVMSPVSLLSLHTALYQPPI